LVTGPDEQVLGQGELLTEKMAALGMPLRGVVLNRLHPLPDGASEDDDRDALARDIASLLGEVGVENASVARWITENHGAAIAQARAEGIRREMFEDGLPPAVVVKGVPELEGDVHDVASLGRLASIIFG
jgi:hypothetical protein